MYKFMCTGAPAPKHSSEPTVQLISLYTNNVPFLHGGNTHMLLIIHTSCTPTILYATCLYSPPVGSCPKSRSETSSRTIFSRTPSVTTSYSSAASYPRSSFHRITPETRKGFSIITEVSCGNVVMQS